MSHPVRWIHRYTYEQYLANEAESNVKHEFLDGEIYAMAGGTVEHAALAANVVATLGAQLRGGAVPGLQLRSKGQSLGRGPGHLSGPHCHLRAAPDGSGKPARGLKPTLLVEVTSPSSETWDRGEKLDAYKRIPSLRVCVLVSHRAQHLEVHERSENGEWIRSEARQGEQVPLTMVGATLAVDEMYEGTAVPALT